MLLLYVNFSNSQLPTKKETLADLLGSYLQLTLSFCLPGRGGA
jgi:hypothetical protein